MKHESNRNNYTRFKPSPGKTYIAFFKPYEVLCQFSKEAGSEKRTLAEFDFPKDVYPVGRLDYDSEGLLILSDDGRLNSALLNPEQAHWRTYLAQVENIPTIEALTALKNGVLIEGKKTLPAKAELLSEVQPLPERSKPIRFRQNIPTAWLKLSLIEGRNRQVRKMTAHVGHPTLRLVRLALGEVELLSLNLAPGQWKHLSPEEIEQLFS
ncbi:MAG: pseudouridine synthase [Candidatus Obscuribacterales bacterium]|nr:pseudouridine synthase [Candidatus Obscuribacterales bacterium]